MRRRLVDFFLGLARLFSRNKRSYASALINRLTADWTTVPTTANRELRFNLRTLRARSRQLARDDDYMRRFLHLLKTNVVGAQGIQLQVRLINRRGRNETETNQTVEASFKRWCKAANCTVTRRLSWRAALELIMRTVAVDGEAFVRFVPTNNKWGLSLQLLNADWFDESFNETLPNGNRVIMSVNSISLPAATPFNYDHAVQMETLADDQDVPTDGQRFYVCRPSVYGKLRTRTKQVNYLERTPNVF